MEQQPQLTPSRLWMGYKAVSLADDISIFRDPLHEKPVTRTGFSAGSQAEPHSLGEGAYSQDTGAADSG